MMKKILIKLVKIYQIHFSYQKGRSTCIYIPTCSHYALQSLEKYGAVKGSYLTMKRLLKCHPFSKGGYDPLP